MIQLVLTIIIVSIAVVIALYRIVKFLKNPYSKCDGCAKDCGGCAVEMLKKEIEQKKVSEKEKLIS